MHLKKTILASLTIFNVDKKINLKSSCKRFQFLANLLKIIKYLMKIISFAFQIKIKINHLK